MLPWLAPAATIYWECKQGHDLGVVSYLCTVLATKWFLTVWLRACAVNLLAGSSNLPHVAHAKGCSPVWARASLVKSLAEGRFWPHVAHTKSFSPVWVRACCVKALGSAKPLPHVTHA